MRALHAAVGIAGIFGLAWLTAAIFVYAEKDKALRNCTHRADVCVMEFPK